MIVFLLDRPPLEAKVVRKSRKINYVAAEQRRSMRHVELALVGPGEIVGEEICHHETIS